ncbi:hypothetical protein AMTR_s00203p00030160 [Amborella trichopoda]|uniref:Uncharacterized protein n=1 Tax=Amborella trichopoda TaxID=13333 RepID=W1P1K9_AMBTC|nr:hypothetical protein AMTR_s00203p00030160 [Amborella trichopoda]
MTLLPLHLRNPNIALDPLGLPASTEHSDHLSNPLKDFKSLRITLGTTIRLPLIIVFHTPPKGPSISNHTQSKVKCFWLSSPTDMEADPCTDNFEPDR